MNELVIVGLWMVAGSWLTILVGLVGLWAKAKKQVDKL